MYKRMCIMICFLVMAVPGSLLAQLQVDGEWELDKVHIRLYSHQSNKLLEESIGDTLPQQVTLVGQEISFIGERYIMRSKQRISEGLFLLLSDGSLTFRNPDRLKVDALGQQLPDVFCVVKMPEPDKMVITLPEEVYKDRVSGTIVRQLFICQYKRKK